MDLRGKSVLIWGDSQAAGIGPHLQQLLPGARVEVDAQVGLPLRGALGRLLPPSGRDVAIVSLGGNNPTGNPQIAKAAFRTVLAALPKTVFWITVLPSLDPEQQAARARMVGFQRRFLPGMGVRIIDGAAIAQGLPRAGDVHLTGSGYEVAARRTVAWIGGLPGPVMLGIGATVSAAIARTRTG